MTSEFDPKIRETQSILDRCGLSYTDGAVIIHVSPTTLRFVLATGKLPRNITPRRRIERFVLINATAQRRSDIRLVDDI